MNDAGKREKIHELLDMVLDINGFEERKRGVSGNKPTAFLMFSGHVANIEVDIHTDGWAPGENADLCARFYLDEKYNDNDIIHAIERVSEYKEAFLGSGGCV